MLGRNETRAGEKTEQTQRARKTKRKKSYVLVFSSLGNDFELQIKAFV